MYPFQLWDHFCLFTRHSLDDRVPEHDVRARGIYWLLLANGSIANVLDIGYKLGHSRRLGGG